MMRRKLISLNPTKSPAYHYIDTPQGLKRLIREIKGAKRVALDTEANSLYRYYEKVCLIQLTIEDENYIVDPLAEMDISRLMSALAGKPLILHGADYDLRMLRSSFDFIPKREIFDTQEAARLLGFERFGLAALLERFFGVELSKQGQKSNWGIRPLRTSQLEYAINDTKYLAPLADKLQIQLEEIGRSDWHTEMCKRLVLSSQNDNRRDRTNAWRIKGLQKLSPKHLAFVKEIWHWREKQAQKADIPPFKIMGNHLIIELAEWAVSHPDAPLGKGPKLPRHCVGGRLHKLESAIQKGRDLPKEKWPANKRPHTRTESVPNCRSHVNALRRECELVANKLEIPPSMLAPRAALAAIARKRPHTLDEVMSAGSLMKWQAELLHETIVRVLHGT